MNVHSYETDSMDTALEEITKLLVRIAELQASLHKHLDETAKEKVVDRQMLNDLMTQLNEVRSDLVGVRSDTHAAASMIANKNASEQKFQIIVLVLCAAALGFSFASWSNSRYLIRTLSPSPEHQLLMEMLRERDAIRRAAVTGVTALTTG
jgi:chromosome segregation ATPase